MYTKYEIHVPHEKSPEPNPKERKMESSVDLGFIETCEPWLLTNKFFPSKLGGRPAWLDLEKIPQPSEVKCAECDGELTFLCQVYAPLDEYEHCFHRTIYVFICTNTSCWHPNTARNIKVVRCQLPRRNAFYAYEPSSEDVKSDEVSSPVRLCLVCGGRGPLSCGKCKLASYCGASHQKIDWSLGEHKQICGTADFDAQKSIGNPKHGVLFDEFELVTEPEEHNETVDDESEEQAEQRRLKDYEKFVAEQSAKGTDDILKDVPDEEFNKYSSQIDEDVVFGKFKKRIDLEKEQILRFDRKGNPLWITDKSRLDSNDVPNCERCGSKRVFEFQIMPQLLNHLGKPDLDWGVICVYTCESSCDTSGEYATEFVYKQDIVADATNES